MRLPLLLLLAGLLLTTCKIGQRSTEAIGQFMADGVVIEGLPDTCEFGLFTAIYPFRPGSGADTLTVILLDSAYQNLSPKCRERLRLVNRPLISATNWMIGTQIAIPSETINEQFIWRDYRMQWRNDSTLQLNYTTYQTPPEKRRRKATAELNGELVISVTNDTLQITPR